MQIIEPETIHQTLLENCVRDISELREMFKSKSSEIGEEFDLFEFYPNSDCLKKLKRAMESYVSEVAGEPHLASRGWVKSLEPGSWINFHAHDRAKRLDPSLLSPPHPVGVFYLTGTSPIMFFPYHEEPVSVAVEPGMFLMFRSDFHHFVPPTPVFRQSLAVNFEPRK